MASLKRHLMGFRGTACLVAAPTTLLLAVGSPAAAAPAGPTRGEYRAAVEPICKSETRAHRNVLRGVDKMVQRGKLRKAGPRMMRAAVALRNGIRKIAAVPRPSADVARLKRWFRFSRAGVRLLRKIGLALRASDRKKTERLANALLRETKRANATVVGFNFNHCRVEPARFV